MSVDNGICRQSSRAYFQRKDHRDAVFNDPSGNYPRWHSAMYAVNDTCDGFIWRKMPPDLYFVTPSGRVRTTSSYYDFEFLCYPKYGITEGNAGICGHFVSFGTGLMAPENNSYGKWNKIAISKDGKLWKTYEVENTDDIYTTFCINGSFYYTYASGEEELTVCCCTMDEDLEVVSDEAIGNVPRGITFTGSPEAIYAVGVYSYMESSTWLYRYYSISPSGISVIMTHVGSDAPSAQFCFDGTWYYFVNLRNEAETVISLYLVQTFGSGRSLIKTVTKPSSSRLIGMNGVIRRCNGRYYAYVTGGLYQDQGIASIHSASRPLGSWTLEKNLTYAYLPNLHTLDHFGNYPILHANPLTDGYDYIGGPFEGYDGPMNVPENSVTYGFMPTDVAPAIFYENNQMLTDPQGTVLLHNVFSTWNYNVLYYFDNPLLDVTPGCFAFRCTSNDMNRFTYGAIHELYYRMRGANNG